MRRTQSAWLTLHGHWLSAAVLASAGAFQFSALKYRCLDRCRTPFGFINERRHGRNRVSNLACMLVLAALMAAEKNLPIGRRLAAPVGIALFGAALAVALGAV